MNQKKMARMLNKSESYITRLINGERYSKEFEIFIYYELGVSYRNLKITKEIYYEKQNRRNERNIYSNKK